MIFTKIQDPDLSQLEYEKSIRAKLIAADSRLFCTPGVLYHDPVKGIIEFEHLKELTPLKRSVPYKDDLTSVFLRVGSALATIHSHLSLPQEMTKRVPGNWKSGEDVFLHGDFSLVNMSYNPESDCLFVFDWNCSDWLGQLSTTGTNHIDLLTLIHSFFVVKDMNQVLLKRSLNYIRAFLQGYQDESGSTVNLDDLNHNLQIVHQRYLDHKKSTPRFEPYRRSMKYLENSLWLKELKT